jgi:predicted nucleotidyltransferase
MPPAENDLRIARAFAKRVVIAGRGRVRRVVLVGSRALGTARADSDLDVVVLVETAESVRPWGTPECAAERDRLQREVGAPPLPTDLWVRTTDQYQEARGVFGSVEAMVDTEGIDLYAEPFQRAPRVRRTPAQVRREYTVGWVTHALRALEEAYARQASMADRPGVAALPPDLPAHACIVRSLLALLFARQIRSERGDGVDALLARYSAVDEATAHAVRADYCSDGELVSKAHAVLTRVVGQLARDPALAKELKGIQRTLLKRSGVGSKRS